MRRSSSVTCIGRWSGLLDNSPDHWGSKIVWTVIKHEYYILEGIKRLKLRRMPVLKKLLSFDRDKLSRRCSMHNYDRLIF